MCANSNVFPKGTSAIGGYRVTIPFPLCSKIHEHSSNEQHAHAMSLLAKVSFAGQSAVANALSFKCLIISLMQLKY